jgi:hypothetical protein
MKKVNVYREKINDKKMIYPTDEEGGFSRFDIECKKNVDVEKRTKDADNKKKNIGFRLSTPNNR